MNKKLMMLLLLGATMVPVAAQTEMSHILIHKVDSSVDTLLLNNVLDVYHSRRDVNGEEQTDVSTLRLRTVTGERVYPLSEIDHVVMPRHGRIISFMGTTQPTPATNGARRTSVYTEDMLNADNTNLYYQWVAGDRIWLSNGDKSNAITDRALSNNKRLGQFDIKSDSLMADQYVVYYPGTNATVYNKVTIPAVQTQSAPNVSTHIGSYGDCGTATATRQGDSKYVFSLDHKTAILSFIPRYAEPDVISTLQLKQVAVKAANGETLAGSYTLSPAGVVLDGYGSDSITLRLQTPFALPQHRVRAEGMAKNPQDSVATFVVVAPQPAATTLNVYYTLHDTKTEIDTVVPKTVTISGIEGSYIYPVTHTIPLGYFQAAMTDSAKWAFDMQPTLYGSVNLKTQSSEAGSVGFIWGYNKNLTEATSQADIKLSHDADLTFSTTLADPVKQRAYYYRAYARDVDHEGNAKTFWGKVKKFGMEREIINMGTSVRWSSINLGAITEEDEGDYYAWGELAPKTNFTEGLYKYYDTATRTYTDIGEDISGNPLYDPATALWRGCWRMPTQAEMGELSSKCNRSWVSREDEDGHAHNGLLLTNRNNADSTIFLSAAGYYNGTTLTNNNSSGHYLTATQHAASTMRDAYLGNNFLNTGSGNNGYKYQGRTIRPVFDSNIETKKGEYLFIRTDYIEYSDDQTEAHLYGTMRGLDDVVTDISQGFVVGTSAEVKKDNALVSDICQDAKDNGSYNILLNKEELAKQVMGTKHYVRAYIDYDGETYYGDAVEMVAMEIHTDSTDWKVGVDKNVRLCGTAKGISAGMLANVELGFVAGFTPDVEMETAHDTLVCDSTVNGKFVCLLDTVELKQYYYRAYLKNKLNGHIFYASLDNVKMLGLEYIDLGLPSGLRWANINVGAQTPKDNGSYYAWGETKPDTRYDQAGYQYYQNGGYVNIGESVGGTYDIGGTTYDAAQVNWQGAWRMPTKAETQELLDNCSWERTVLYGKQVYKLTSKINSNVIYLPCAGYINGNTTNVTDGNARILYWTSTMKATDSSQVWSMDNNTSRTTDNNAPSLNYSVNYWRYEGYPVRPVAMVNDTLADKSQIMLTTDSVQWAVGQTEATLHGYLLGLRYHDKAEESGFVYATTPGVTNETSDVKYLKTNQGDTHNVANGHFECTMTGIEDNTVYYYRAYVKVDGKYYFANEREFGRRFVDLGIDGILWSNINLGARSADDSGDYYAWGETTPRGTFTRDNYTAEAKAIADADISGSSHDAANVQWKGLTRMPTADDLSQLISQCTWTEVVKYGQPMYKVVGTTGDSIFIAKRGSVNGTAVGYDGQHAYFWTSTLCTTDGPANDNAYGAALNGTNHDITAVARYLGYTIRPVQKYTHTLSDQTKIYLSTDSTDWQVGHGSLHLCATLNGTDASAEHGFIVGYSDAIQAVDNDLVASVTVDTLSAVDHTFRATVDYDKDTTYYYRAYTKVGNEYYYGETRRYGLELVDMGNGIKWASINIGAQRDADRGRYFAWGETTTKTTFTEPTYRHYNNGYTNIGADISGVQRYDVAKAEWGGTWRLPTLAEMRVLTDSCQWTWTTVDGQAGYRVYSPKTEKSIFLPAAGYQEISYYYGIGTACYYWTSSRYSTDNEAYSLNATSADRQAANRLRYLGQTVRPVTSAGADEGSGGGITGGHKPGSSQQTGGETTGSGNAGTGNTGQRYGD